ncbi:hypothetical protein [Synergistes jonesii]|uniref:hypothetical protein n=1 Tax=Synergistes jonesii TaxID=2754 RepID=UPI00248E9E85|nr:hypothetical protein [Synergistes jonesii]
MKRVPMTGYRAMHVIRMRANDVQKLTYSDEEILADINSAIRYLSAFLIKRRSPEMIHKKIVYDYMALPEGFHSLVGQNPAWVEDGTFRTYSGKDALVPVRYFCTRTPLASLTDAIPFPDDYFDVIVETALSLLKSSDEYDVSAETEIFDRMAKMLPGDVS